MIEEKCFTREWIDAFKKQPDHKDIQAVILEKMIHALHLIELLQIHELDFTFKGGTSLILLLNEGNRFSIDIDIVCSVDKESLKIVFSEIIAESKFTVVNLDERRSYKEGGIPKAHYAFEFESVYEGNSPGKLLLDILLLEPIYPEMIQSPIKTKWIETDTEIAVNTPSIDSITGDKLTAFAPNTVGIPYYKSEKNCSMQICKQLFDLSKLFPVISNIKVVNESFMLFAKEGIRYKQLDQTVSKNEITPNDVLQDTIDTCRLIAKRDANKDEPFKTQYSDIASGITAFGANFLMTGKFRIEDAIIGSASVAHLATKLLVGDLSPIEYFKGQDIKEKAIEDPNWQFLNRLKRQPDKSSFFYWYNTVQLLVTART